MSLELVPFALQFCFFFFFAFFISHTLEIAASEERWGP